VNRTAVVNREHRVTAAQDRRNEPRAKLTGLARFPAAAHHHEHAKAVWLGWFDNVQRKFPLATFAIDNAVRALHGRMEIPPSRANDKGQQRHQTKNRPQETTEEAAKSHAERVLVLLTVGEIS
jgi:hypothetical protein